MKTTICLLVSSLVLSCFATTSFGKSVASKQGLSNDAIFDVLSNELKRSWNHFQKRKKKPKVYYMRYLFQKRRKVSIAARDGVIFSSSDTRKKPQHNIRVEVRVGNYQFDSSGSRGYDSNLYRPLVHTSGKLPATIGKVWLAKKLWRKTDYEYKVAMARYQKKSYSRSLKVEIKDKSANFSKEKPVEHYDKAQKLTFQTKRWKKIAQNVSAVFLKNPKVVDSVVSLSASQTNQIIVGSDGSKILKNKTLYMYLITLTYLSPKKEYLRNTRLTYVDAEHKLPSEKKLKALAQKTLQELILQGNAKQGEHIEAPAILLPDVAGVLFHEALGHRLEAQRMLKDSDGKTFLKKIGKSVTPSFLTIFDDPTLSNWKGTPLNGYYLVDDQGVRSRRTKLIERGILKGFLMSRKPVPPFHQSNGHGRASFGYTPVSRMGNVIVKSYKEFSFETLKAKLIAEAKRQKKPYAYIISRASGGYTHTGTYGIQSFKNRPKLVYQIDVKTGKKILVKGLEMIGTPLTVVKNILATGKKYGVFNGFCGAESGYVPVSVVAPSLLLKTVELQRIRIQQKKTRLLPAPPALVGKPSTSKK